MQTLEQILEREKAHRIEGGMFGITACKKSIAFQRDYCHRSLYELLEEYMESANTDALFNKAMVLACWEMINEREKGEEPKEEKKARRKANHPYTVEYMEHSASKPEYVIVLAASKEEAYDKAVYETLEHVPYAAWVAGVTYQNGNYRRFNTHAGKRF